MVIESYFVGADEVLQEVLDAEPDDSHVSPTTRARVVGSVDRSGLLWDLGSPYLVSVPVQHILFMEGNQWNFDHAAALVHAMDGENVFEPPAGRVYVIDKSSVKLSREYDAGGELEYQMNMVRPWAASDVGQLYAQLLDGNHRAAAAILAGATHIPVHVGENYREDIPKSKYLKQRRS